MKKQLFILLAMLMIVTLVVGLTVYQQKKQQLLANQTNQFYENYLNQQISGTDLISVINKAIDENEKNAIEKHGIYYQENNENSIKIELHFLEDDRTILMEDIAEKTTESFVKFFGIAKFECTKVTYHSKTGKIKSLTFQQQS